MTNRKRKPEQPTEEKPSAELATRRHASSLTLEPDQEWWTPAQRKGLEQLGLAGASDGDLLVFHHVAQRTGLDPFARQIHMVSRNVKTDNGGWAKKWTIQTGIDGFRLIADRADRRDGTRREYEDTMWADDEGVWHDVWVKPVTPPTAARVVVVRDGKRYPAVVLYREYVQTKRNGDLTGMWEKMPANQLAKCAEAAALRKAYPQDLSGMYTDDEMQQADSRGGTAAQQVSGLASVLEDADTSADTDTIDGEVLPEPDEPHDYVNNPETGACAVEYSDGTVCGELEDRPPHVPAGQASEDQS